VIVPCLDEEANLASTIADILAVAPDLPVDVDVLMIDDGSTDGTRALMERLCAEHPRLRMRVNPGNLGLGRSVMRAYEEIPEGTWVTVFPGDNEYVFASVANLLEARARYDIVLGYLQNPVIRPIMRRLASYAFTKVVSSLYGFSFRYLNGFKLYRVETVRGLDVVSGGHAYTAEILAKAVLRQPLLRIGEAPFAARGRAEGASKAFRPQSILRAVREVVAGFRSVQAYRDQLLRAQAVPGPSAGVQPGEPGGEPAVLSPAEREEGAPVVDATPQGRTDA